MLFLIYFPLLVLRWLSKCIGVLQFKIRSLRFPLKGVLFAYVCEHMCWKQDFWPPWSFHVSESVLALTFWQQKLEKSVFLYIRVLYINKHLYKYNPPNIGFYVQFWNMVIHLYYLTFNNASTNVNISGCFNTHRVHLFYKVGTDFSCCTCSLLLNKLSGKVKLEQHSLWCSNISNCKFLAIHKPQFWNRKQSLSIANPCALCFFK